MMNLILKQGQGLLWPVKIVEAIMMAWNLDWSTLIQVMNDLLRDDIKPLPEPMLTLMSIRWVSARKT